ncbi:cytochrome c oxidase biogenesis protein cmc1-like protein [Moniliophthora roreri MCA 2997]|uniref:COX assembly mitochondrial protein n=2 Tax=Moniliophthora roreri TaxID=221103 RepID=V2X0C5_MONRO|nr:cytochrome c oxidase biogenesis protein cmc1-like protein [Moniliophthora roreri MCA 2997]KAI3610782.1 cytochrome c oxidase biogenesis protein cmc1-like protein [Moniliophthora roreri]
MHPQLSDKRIVCKDFIQALEQCHLSTWKKFTGGCNKYKDEMNRCLHAESMKRSAANRENSKIRQAKREKAIQEFVQDS